jgi:hypothetical protein
MGKFCGFSRPILWADPPLIICIAFSLVKSSLPATRNLFNDDICESGVDKERMLLPNIRRHKIATLLMDPSSDPSHIRTLRG